MEQQTSEAVHFSRLRKLFATLRRRREEGEDCASKRDALLRIQEDLWNERIRLSAADINNQVDGFHQWRARAAARAREEAASSNRQPHWSVVLGVDSDASLEKILDAFRALAKRYYPQATNGKGDPEKFAKVLTAFKQAQRERGRYTGLI